MNSGSLDLQPVWKEFEENEGGEPLNWIKWICSNGFLQHFSFRYQHNPVHLKVISEKCFCLFELAGS